jgi:hypothetical protein
MSTEVLGTSAQLQITIPRARTRDWAVSIRNNCFQKIVEHDHSGVSGKGIQLATAAIAADAITGLKILLANDQYLRARNAADNADVNIVKVSSGNEVVFGTTIATADFQDDGLTISDNADNTKKIALNAGNITTGTTRTISAPDATGTLVLEDNAVTLTNKTLTAPVISTISNTGVLTLPTATTTLVGTNTSDVLTNKSIDADTNTITNIDNADIKSGAAIAVNKLAAITASRAVVSDGSGFVSAASTTATEIGYVSGVTSAIQTQIDAKLTSPLTTNGDILYYNSGHQRLAKGTDGQVLQLSSGLPSWTAAPAAVDTVVEITNADSPYTALTSTNTLLVDASAGVVTVNLYAVSGNGGKKINIIKTDSSTNAVTIDGDSAETIDGNATRILRTQYEGREIQVNNSANAWFTINRKNTTPWAGYTPTTNGLGSPLTNVNVRWKRIGDTVFVTGSFNVATVTAAEARIGLPNSYTISTSMIADEVIVGHCWDDANSSSIFSIIATNGDAFVNVSYHTSSTTVNGLAPKNGSGTFTSNSRISFTFQVEVNELQD